ncbi:MAG: hypothetical protein IKS54_09645 [Erysipelotrichaceae bacterium]|nr:hypothetical protein [Erysipelotrichaceae bacterium]
MRKKKSRFSFIKFLLFLVIAFILVDFLLGLFSSMQTSSNTVDNTPTPAPAPAQTEEKPKDDEKADYNGFTSNLSTVYSNNWQLSSNVGKLDMQVTPGIRAKRTKVLGNQKDTVTIMVYMCGSDLESQAAMGVYDLQEMANAKIADNVNLIVYTGGCTRWHTDFISTKVNQIYQVVGNGQIGNLVDNAGTGSMVDPNTLVSFIEFCAENFEANRYELIMWDHGGGSVSGYGYDEKYPKRGSMSLAQLDSALTAAGVKFDFVGFDACLMATTETALMLSEHADYMIASEESEPGIGWYYTNWLSKLSNNTSMPTIEIGKNIADDFVSMCASKTPNQTATLSVIDLAEIEGIVPDSLTAFSKSTNDLIDTDFRTVVSARKGTREFAQQAGLDLVDLVDLASKIDTPEARQLCQALMKSVKYNITSRGISNAYGLSIYFPYRTTRYVNTVLNTYDNIDMNTEYSKVVRNFASYQTTGQVSSGGSHSAYQSYNTYNSSDYYSNQGTEELLINLMDLFLGGSYSSNDSYSGYYSSGLDSLFGGRVSDQMAKYIVENHFDGDLTWKDKKIALTEKQWSMIDSLKLNLFMDDGKGYIDLGKDSVFDIDENGNLLAPEDLTWLAISTDDKQWHVVAYYDLYSTIDGDNTIYTGRIPVLINDKYANLITMIDDDSAQIVGAVYDYKGEADIVSKTLYELSEDDVIQPVCDFYDYDGNFVDAYPLEGTLTYKDNLSLGDVDISSYKTLISYEFKDLYGQSFWSTAIK